jgi:hypothetical protein
LDLPPLSLSFILILSFLEQFQQVLFHFHAWIQNTSTIFALFSHFLLPSPLPLVPIPGEELFCLLVLHLLKNNISGSLVILFRINILFSYFIVTFPYVCVCVCLCITPEIGSSLLLFSLLPHSPSYGVFNRFQSSIFILVWKVHQLYSFFLISSVTFPIHKCHALNMTCFMFLLFFIKVSFHCSLGILPWNFTSKYIGLLSV